MSERIDEISKKWSFLGATLSDEDINDLFLEIEGILSNQIPGRCGECAERRVGRNSFGQYSYCMWKNGEFDPDGYCDEWKPKEDV